LFDLGKGIGIEVYAAGIGIPDWFLCSIIVFGSFIPAQE
jgi:hypothetical protein